MQTLQHGPWTVKHWIYRNLKSGLIDAKVELYDHPIEKLLPPVRVGESFQTPLQASSWVNEEVRKIKK